VIAGLVALRLGLALLKGTERNTPLRLVVVGLVALALRPVALAPMLTLIDAAPALRAVEVLLALLISGTPPGAFLGALASVHRQAIRARFAQMRAMDLELARAQRETRLSQLADGLATDFTEVIAGVKEVTNGLASLTPSDEVVPRSTRVLRQAVARAEVLIRQLEDCSAPPVEGSTVFDLAELVHRNIASLRALGPEHEVQLGPMTSLRVLGAKNEVERILYNLLENAFDATPELGPAIEIRLERIQPDRAALASATALQSGRDYARLTVADEGGGIAEEDIALAFQPYFTTKAEAGTGLGLPASRGLARKCGGDLSIESRLGAGARVHLWLPLSEAAEKPAA
jgi:signal transduction histidine kinase